MCTSVMWKYSYVYLSYVLSTLEKILILLNSFKWYYIPKRTPLNYPWRKNKIALEKQGQQADSWNFGEMSAVFGFIFKGKKNFPSNFIRQ